MISRIKIYLNNTNSQLLFSLICGMLGVLSFSPYDFWPASIISFTGLLIKIIGNTYKNALWNTLFWGIGLFGAGLHWIYIGISRFINTYCFINIFLIILLILYLTCFPILFTFLFVLLQPYISKWNLIGIIPILWVIIEHLRGYIIVGFPWLQLGYSQIDGPIKGVAPILGVEGITFILTFISSLLALSIKQKEIFPLILSLIILILFSSLKWVHWCYDQPQLTTRIALVQGNVHQNLDWNEDNIQSTLKLYLNHTVPILKKTKIIIWPESAIPGYEINHNEFLIELDDLCRKNKTFLITGIINTQNIGNNYKHFNTIIVLGDSEPYIYSNNNRYIKHHLVLFAERFPIQEFLKPILYYLNIPIDFMQKGSYLQPQLHADKIKITAAICYEVILGQQIRNNFKPNSNFLLTVANDAWFENSIGPWQHFQMIRMRSLELGRPMLCCTNNGITAIIQSDGSIQTKLPQFISAVLTADVIPTKGITPYAKFGSSWLFGISIIYLLYLFLSIK